MRKGFLKYFSSLFIFLLFGCGEMPVDWYPSFDSKDTIPFGTYVLRQELTEIFPDSKVYNIHQKTEDYLDEILYDYRYDHYMFIYNELMFDESTWEKITEYVYKGGSAFISMPVHNLVFERSLGVKTTKLPYSATAKGVHLSVKNPDSEKEYLFEKGYDTAYFSDFVEDKTEILGYIQYNDTKAPNFLKVYHGNGYFLLHAEPVAFTNYYMLRQNNHEYVTSVLSYLSPEDILWDNHRIHRRQSGERNDGGLFNGLNFIMKHEALRWAFFLLVSLGVLYLFFNSKRRQKAVPIVLPYPNYTLDFAKTLSELYRYNADHTAMVRYKINYFLEQLKQRYNITSKDTEKDFSEVLSAKSGVDINLCKKLVLTIDIFRSKNYLDKEDFFKLQALIESFNHKSNHYGRPSTRK